jgi:hypothetical protein
VRGIFPDITLNRDRARRVVSAQSFGNPLPGRSGRLCAVVSVLALGVEFDPRSDQMILIIA